MRGIERLSERYLAIERHKSEGEIDCSRDTEKNEQQKERMRERERGERD